MDFTRSKPRFSRMRGMVHGFLREHLLPPARDLSAAFLYQDFSTLSRAAHLYEFLLREVGLEADLHATWWRLCLMADPKIRQAALRALQRANLVVLSLHPDASLNPLPDEWLEFWPVDEPDSAVLLAVLEGPDDGRTDREQRDAFFREFAQRHHLLYLSDSTPEFEEEAVFYHPPPVASALPPGALPNSPWPAEPYVHWGLNE